MPLMCHRVRVIASMFLLLQQRSQLLRRRLLRHSDTFCVNRLTNVFLIDAVHFNEHMSAERCQTSFRQTVCALCVPNSHWKSIKLSSSECSVNISKQLPKCVAFDGDICRLHLCNWGESVIESFNWLSLKWPSRRIFMDKKWLVMPHSTANSQTDN